MRGQAPAPISDWLWADASILGDKDFCLNSVNNVF